MGLIAPRRTKPMRTLTFLVALGTMCLSGQLHAQFRITPSTIDFGRVAVGTEAEETFRISSSDFSATLRIRSTSPTFTVAPTRPRVTPSSPRDITVTFSPLEPGEFEAEITVAISADNVRIGEVEVVGEGFLPTGPACQIVPQNLEITVPFCRAPFADPLSVDFDVRVTNDGEPAAGVVARVEVTPDILGLFGQEATGEDGVSSFRANIPPLTFGPQLLTATGSIDGEQFLCRAVITLNSSPYALIEALIAFFCGFQCILPENAEALDLLRRFRDGVLSPDDLGRDYSKQYYEFSTEIVRIMAAEPMLLLRARDKLERHTTLIEPILNGQPGRLSRDELRGIIEVLEAFEAKASPELRETIVRLKNDLANPEILARFGFLLEPAVPSEQQPEPGSERALLGSEPNAPTGVRLDTIYGKLPLSFETNEGQVGSVVDYLARTPGFQLYLSPDEAVLAMGPKANTLKRISPTSGSAALAEDRGRSESVIRMQLLGADRAATPSGLEELPGRSHYLMGSNSENWLTNIPHYRKVRYEGVYPDIDVVYYGRRGQLEYDFVLAPGASPEQIRLGFEGVEHAQIDSQGDLRLSTASGDLSLQKPLVYQEVAGVRHDIAGAYELIGDGRIGFDLAEYDPALPLVIDPILSYSSFLGGSDQELSMGISIDRDGNAYLTGATTSANFAAESLLGEGFVGGGLFGSDGFVTKINPEGTGLVYSTYFGGSGDEIGLGVVADSFGRVFVAGATSSADFPTAAAIQADFGGGGENYGTDAFVLKLDATGSELAFSTYLGGAADDGAGAIALDTFRDVYVTGATASADFPTARPLQAAHAGGGLFGADAFVAKLSFDGTLVYSTYLGGSGDEAGAGIAADSAANAYVTGLTYSEDFPIMAPLQDARAGAADVFVAKLNPGGNALLYSTYLGGQSDDFGLAIDIDGEGNAYLTGLTGSSGDFPLVGAAQENFGSEDGSSFDAFVTKLSSDGSALVYSTYLGGSEAEAGFGIAVDRDGNAYVAGETASPDFPVMNAIQSFNGGLTDGFVAKLDPTGAAFDFRTYLGGSNHDFAAGIDVDREGNTYIGGGTGSTNSPATLGALQTSSAGGAADALVAKIIEGEPAAAIATVLAASGGLSVSPASIASGFGEALAADTVLATEIPLPTELGGVSLRITDSAGTEHLAPFFFVAAGQLNFFVPADTALGLALVEVLQDGVVVATGTVQVEAVAPGIFTANADGQGPPAAFYLRFRGAEQTAQEFTFDPNALVGEREPVLIDFGDEDELLFIAIFGTGMRGGSTLTATIDGEDVPVTPVVALEDFVGLDQANVGPIPRSFIGRGLVELQLFVDGMATNVVLLLL